MNLTLRIRKMNDLIKAQDAYIELLDKSYSRMYGIAALHGVRETEENIKSGKEHRETIANLKTELS